MKRGIAFIRGISMFGNKNYTKKEIFNCVKQIEDKKIRIIGMYGNDNIIFDKADNLHFASVGTKIERCLTKHFDTDFSVTTRSLQTIKHLLENSRGKL